MHFGIAGYHAKPKKKRTFLSEIRLFSAAIFFSNFNVTPKWNVFIYVHVDILDATREPPF